MSSYFHLNNILLLFFITTVVVLFSKNNAASSIKELREEINVHGFSSLTVDLIAKIFTSLILIYVLLWYIFIII